MNNAREDTIDCIRGIAIFLVILGHVLQCFSCNSDQYLTNKIYLNIYSFHMPLFMFISGVVYKKSLISGHANLKRRTVQLIYPYILWGGTVTL